MAQRRISQETFEFGAKPERKTSLDELHALIDRAIAEEPLAVLYKSPKGEKAWPPLAMFKAFLLAIGTVFPMWPLPRLLLTGQVSGAFAVLRAMRQHPSGRRSCGFAAT